MESSLRRYTELPYLIEYLQSKELVLLNPASWEDRNDSYYIEQYNKSSGLKCSYALCLTDSPETYHHWKIFAYGSGGVCIEFDKNKLVNAVSKVTGLRSEHVKYSSIEALRKSEPMSSDLPFLKRYAFIDEKEYRLFYGVKNAEEPEFRISVPIASVARITLSPWLEKSVVKQVKGTLKSIEGCESLEIYRSTLIENESWKKIARYRE